MEKKLTRQRRARRGRMKIKELGAARLSVHRTGQHLYAQVLIAAEKGDKVLACASTLDKKIRSAGVKGSNVASASMIGKTVAERALAAGIKSVAFDRSGFRYHGRIKALAEAAREAGLEF